VSDEPRLNFDEIFTDVPPGQAERPGYAWAFLGSLIALGVIVGNVWWIMFMPWFWRRVKWVGSVALDADAQPRLYRFAARVAELAETPAPTRVEVDCGAGASARFERGERVLVIGLTQVATMDVRELAGLIAHETTHFAQRKSVGLCRFSNRFSPFLQWLKPLRLLFRPAAALSRGLEYEADETEARIAGRAAFERVLIEAPVLHAATKGAHLDLAMAHEAGRRPDSLPALALEYRLRVSDAVIAELTTSEATRKATPASTHPSSAERLAAVASIDAAGAVRSQAAARTLFDGFEALCIEATDEHYRSILGLDPDALATVSAADLAAERAGEQT